MTEKNIFSNFEMSFFVLGQKEQDMDFFFLMGFFTII